VRMGLTVQAAVWWVGFSSIQIWVPNWTPIECCAHTRCSTHTLYTASTECCAHSRYCTHTGPLSTLDASHTLRVLQFLCSAGGICFVNMACPDAVYLQAHDTHRLNLQINSRQTLYVVQIWNALWAQDLVFTQPPDALHTLEGVNHASFSG
jgi:hypothetical protein